MTGVLNLLHAPLGQPGSGRLRYGAAMALWRDGLISAEVLEVYRVASAHDARDPLDVLARLGLPLPPKPPVDLPTARLYGAARDYLLRLHHPGAAEVRAGLPADPGPGRVMMPRPNAVAPLSPSTSLSSPMAVAPLSPEAIDMVPIAVAPWFPVASHRSPIAVAPKSPLAVALIPIATGPSAPDAVHDW